MSGDYSSVDGSTLDTEELYEVIKAVKGCKVYWYQIGLALRLAPSTLEEAKEANQSDPSKCMRDILGEWLKKNYKTEKFGSPSWRMLVKAVAEVNRAVAENIAGAHPGPEGATPPAPKPVTPPAPVAKHSKVLDEKPTNRDLTLMKWRKDGQTQRLKIADTICNEWRQIGKILSILPSKLETWSTQARGDPLGCLNKVLDHWFQNPPEDYPLKWSAFIDLLEDIDFTDLAQELREALDNRR